MPRIHVRWTKTVLCAFLLAALAMALGITYPGPAHAAPMSKLPPPKRVIQTADGPIAVYDLSQISPLGSYNQYHTNSGQATHPTNYVITGIAGIVFIIDADTGSLICGYFTGTAQTSPASGEANEQGDYYINGNLVATTNTDGTSQTTDETACFAGLGHGSVWHAVVDAAGYWGGGIYATVQPEVYALQP